MSARSTDLNPNVYVGLSLPLKPGRGGDFKKTKTILEQARSNLKNLLLTHVGERLNQPQFGSNLRALIFEQIDDELPTKIDTEVRRATNLWLPYIVISKVNTLTEEGDNNKIVVQIKFSTSLDPQTQETISLDASYTAERV